MIPKHILDIGMNCDAYISLIFNFKYREIKLFYYLGWIFSCVMIWCMYSNDIPDEFLISSNFWKKSLIIWTKLFYLLRELLFFGLKFPEINGQK
jgi:hypothetical protein